MDLLPQLKIISVNAPNIRILLDGSEFQRISDRNSEALFFQKFVAHQGFASSIDKVLAHMYQINVENGKKSIAFPPA
jgi:hypothetical protein